MSGETPSDANDDVVRTTERYYDSSDADRFYAAVWGGEDIHIGNLQIFDDVLTRSNLPEDVGFTDLLDT